MAIFNEKNGDIGNFTVVKESVYRYFDVNDVFPEDEIIGYVKENYTPEDVFD